MGAESVEAHSLVGASKTICTSSKPCLPSSACKSSRSDSSRSASMVLSGTAWVSERLMLATDPIRGGHRVASTRTRRAAYDRSRDDEQRLESRARRRARLCGARDPGARLPVAHGRPGATGLDGRQPRVRRADRPRRARASCPTARAHPDVEATIARTRGCGQHARPGARCAQLRGASATRSTTSASTPTTPRTRSRSSVSARAFTTGIGRLLRERASTSPGSSGGDELLTHELAHVVQQRDAPTSGPLTVSHAGRRARDRGRGDRR